MAYLIWIVSFFVGVGLVMQEGIVVPLGWFVIVAGALAGYKVGKVRERRALAREMQRP